VVKLALQGFSPRRRQHRHVAVKALCWLNEVSRWSHAWNGRRMSAQHVLTQHSNTAAVLWVTKDFPTIITPPLHDLTLSIPRQLSISHSSQDVKTSCNLQRVLNSNRNIATTSTVVLNERLLSLKYPSVYIETDERQALSSSTKTWREHIYNKPQCIPILQITVLS